MTFFNEIYNTVVAISHAASKAAEEMRKERDEMNRYQRRIDKFKMMLETRSLVDKVEPIGLFDWVDLVNAGARARDMGRIGNFIYYCGELAGPLVESSGEDESEAGDKKELPKIYAQSFNFDGVTYVFLSKFEDKNYFRINGSYTDHEQDQKVLEIKKEHPEYNHRGVMLAFYGQVNHLVHPVDIRKQFDLAGINEINDMILRADR